MSLEISWVVDKHKVVNTSSRALLMAVLLLTSLLPMYEEDLWTEIAKFLDGRSLVMLASTSKWFHRIIMEDIIWKHACLRDLQVPDPGKVAFKWINLYAAAFNWMRIGAFSFDSQNALLTENLIPPLKVLKEKTTEKMLESNGCCVVRNVKSGIWIADLQLVRCPVCDLNTCDGTMQVLDARHIELFLSEGYQDGSWDYELLGSHNEKKQANGASAGIFDIKHLKDRSTSAVLDLKSWVGKPNDWQPKAMITSYAVAVNTNLQENEGLHVKFHVMKSGKNGEIVSIRMSEQLQYDCPDSICGNNHFDIRFPFGIEERQNLKNCSYPGFSLICSNQGRSILSLPGAGDYYVRDIDYLTQEIQLYDPSDCLPKRLMNFSTSFSSSSPFKAVAYRNYTFLTCSTNLVLNRLNVISCLSNSTTSTLATTSSSVASQMISLYSCSIINNSSVPASWAFQYQSDFLTDLITDLVLTWDEPNCQECEVNQGVCGFENAIIREIQCFDSPGTGNKRPVQQVFKFIAITLLIPGITCLIGVSCYFCLEYSRSSRASASIQSITTRTTVAPQPATGLDDSTIESYTKVVLGESGRVPGPNHGSCPICLAEYHPKEIVKCIPECEHCFHAECIDEWLKINGSCPVCRNNPSPARVT
ncbi:hypothetical protein KY285_002283 [Solanum tuberosum]|nr:hypothetical protein KY285_002283 [Solanum tuberosum]